MILVPQIADLTMLILFPSVVQQHLSNLFKMPFPADKSKSFQFISSLPRRFLFWSLLIFVSILSEETLIIFNGSPPAEKVVNAQLIMLFSFLFENDNCQEDKPKDYG